MTTSVPTVDFTLTGLVLPLEVDILNGVQADYNSAFGGNLNPALSTPQGQLASSTTAIIADNNALFAEFVNQVNPDFADGFMQDAIARIYFLNRNPAISTSVQCDCVGASGTIIPVGALAQDTSGVQYVCTQAGVIPIGGTISLAFAAVTPGPTICPIGTLTKIYQQIPGWDTINNPGAGIPGSFVESRADFAYRRQQTVALNAHGSLQSIYAAVFNVPGVIDVYAYENTTNGTITVGATSYSMVAHSIYIGVVGGASQDIANAIWSKKDVGADYNGSTSVTVTDTSGYLYPLPSYTVKYQIPASLSIKFAVNIVNNPALPANIVTLIKNAIIAAFTGSDGGQRARIGATVFASRFYAPISLTDPAVEIITLLIGTSTATLNSVAVGIDKFPTVVAADITVTLI